MWYAKRNKYSISNIKLPEVKGDPRRARPIGIPDDAMSSEALAYRFRKLRLKEKISKDKTDLDLMLKNIRTLLVERDIKMKTVSVNLIDQIYRFENLNNLGLEKSIE